ncbi:E3 ubiquitin-protein ligase MARCHF4-like isoform X2 [Xenia sp. Carnegie-2017]|uniref:E3 ubiquitin-protein ligase MARCHF4-like isoform X2 n=1 Tax=Xenia sp. Carnegie-2017 TaxID=2897299 RepID=UPI001F04F38D|nr:E3 ubiquitin-protein ligase MARCHF4-like isoform X2 [Xenia sp. Carnegie-2017]
MQVLEENDSCLVDITSPKNSFSNCDSIKYSSALSICDSELLCRICRDNDNNQDLLSHCQCKGSIGFVHTSCLLTWIKKSGLDTCELCHEKYVTISRMNKRFWQAPAEKERTPLHP